MPDWEDYRTISREAETDRERRFWLERHELPAQVQAMLDDPDRPRCTSAREKNAMAQYIYAQVDWDALGRPPHVEYQWDRDSGVSKEHAAWHDAWRAWSDKMLAPYPGYWGFLGYYEKAVSAGITHALTLEVERAQAAAMQAEAREENPLLDFLAVDGDGTTRKALIEASGLSDTRVRQLLTDAGDLIRFEERKTPGGGSPTRVYWLAEEPEE